MEVRHKYEQRNPKIIPGQYDLEFYRKYNYEESKHYKINHYPSDRKPDFFRKIYKDEPFLSPVTYNFNSRYAKINTKKELGKSYHVTNRIRGVKYDNQNDKYYVVTNMTENRLDIISNMYYGTPIYWWGIAHANNIFDAFTEIKRGRKLRIPPLQNILSYYCNK